MSEYVSSWLRNLTFMLATGTGSQELGLRSLYRRRVSLAPLTSSLPQYTGVVMRVPI
jgi:hypothetical protein